MGDSPARKNRLRAAREVKFLKLRGAGKCCGNCSQFKKRTDAGGKGYFCERYSDAHGYVVTTTDELCTKHTPLA